MDKQEFLVKLRKGLSGSPQGDIEERLTFYSEMIDDRMEEGLTEEEAVAQIGAVEDVVSQITSEIPPAKPVKKTVKPKQSLEAWKIVLLVLGAPIWLSLLIAAFVVVLSVYIVIWSVMISLWAAGFGVAGCALGGIVLTAFFAIRGNIWTGTALLGAGLVCAGISILLFWGCIQASKGILLLTKKLLLCMKSRFLGKEDTK